jgi:hypothetical protein
MDLRCHDMAFRTFVNLTNQQQRVRYVAILIFCTRKSSTLSDTVERITMLNTLVDFEIGWKIPTRLYGAIVHGEFAAAYMFPAHLPGGSNVTVEILHRTLTKLIEGDVEHGIEKRKLPPTLYLQLDNTAK